MEQLANTFRTNLAPEQPNPYPKSEQDTDNPIVGPTEQPIPPAPTEHVARRVPEQSEFSPGAPPRKL